MAQTKEILDEFYEQSDPWSFTTTADDKTRKATILKLLGTKKFKRALDIGAGEGWITKDLPAEEIHGIELSDKAAARFPKNVKRVNEPHGFYDLIVATGVLYEAYNWREFLDWIKQYSKGTVLIAGIEKDLIPEIAELGEPTVKKKLPYREQTQVILLWQ